MTPKMWMVRAGEGNSLLDEFLSHGKVCIGWPEVGNLTGCSKSQIKDLVTKTYQYNSSKSGLYASLLNKFMDEIKEGDRVVTYDSSARIYHIGVVDSEYLFDPANPNYPHKRSLKWQETVSRDDLELSSRNTLGSTITLFSINKEVSSDLLDKAAGKKTVLSESETHDVESTLKEDIVLRSKEFIKDHISNLSWEEMENLVAGVLRAMGFKTRLTPRGSDRGRDILASPDGLGLKEPRILVEVKHRIEKMGAPEIRSFIAGLRQNDRGLFFSRSGFTQEAKYEADRSMTPVTLMDLDLLADQVIQYYDQFDGDSKALIPLKKIYWPA